MTTPLHDADAPQTYKPKLMRRVGHWWVYHEVTRKLLGGIFFMAVSLCLCAGVILAVETLSDMAKEKESVPRGYTYSTKSWEEVIGAYEKQAKEDEDALRNYQMMMTAYSKVVEEQQAELYRLKAPHVQSRVIPMRTSGVTIIDNAYKLREAEKEIERLKQELRELKFVK